MNNNPPIRVAIVEDNKPFAESLCSLIQLNESMVNVGCYHSAESYQNAPTDARQHSDVLLLDLHLPGRDGLTLIPFLLQNKLTEKILVLTHDDNHLKTLEAIQLGVNGYILKSSDVEEIERTIKEIHDGGCVIDPKLCRYILDSNVEKHEGEPLLSGRQQQILEYLAMGYSKKEIARLLDVSYSTVSQATERIYRKFRVQNVAAAVARAIREGLI